MSVWGYINPLHSVDCGLHYGAPCSCGPNVVKRPPDQPKQDAPMPTPPTREFPHYFRDVSNLDEIDIYRLLELFNVTDHAIGHAIKKLLAAGARGAKNRDADVTEARSTLTRWLEMREEDRGSPEKMASTDRNLLGWSVDEWAALIQVDRDAANVISGNAAQRHQSIWLSKGNAEPPMLQTAGCTEARRLARRMMHRVGESMSRFVAGPTGPVEM